MILREVGQEATKVDNPGIVLIPLEQSDRLLIRIVRRIFWITPAPLRVQEWLDV